MAVPAAIPAALICLSLAGALLPAAAALAAPASAAKPVDQFTAVSCPTKRMCVAVGTTYFGQRMLAERWNGHRWASRSIRVPSGAHGFRLSSVSCSSASRCTAVGFKNVAMSLVTDLLTVADRWNGHTWTLQSTRSP